MWTSSKVRETFLRYFEQNGHTIVASSSLVPVDDPTLLFTNAGMNQFKDVFLGIDKRNYDKATTSQKCVRAGGKHNDLDTVGRTPRHHTFFEMLGNFSFGDYFKKQAIEFAWEFLTEIVKLPQENLWITIYQDDDEANELWQEVTGVKAERIIRLGEADNFWSMGDTGPCGPCSEILYDRGSEFSCGRDDCGIGVCDCDRWLEIWNLVFMQFNRSEDGEMDPLPRPSIDTGMGLERLCSILQNADSNFDTDLFTPIIKHIEELTGKKYQQNQTGFAFRVIADHSRACTFLIADGVLPSNDGRGYVLRRILRRAARFGRALGIEEAFLFKSVDVVTEIMKEAYPELDEKRDFIKEVIKLEEERFLVTLNEGIKRVDEIIKKIKKQDGDAISGQDAFMLYDTYGFPLDLTEDIAEENRLTVDKDGFEVMMEEQRNRAREAKKGENVFAEARIISGLLNGTEPTVFTGYKNTEEESVVLAIIKDGLLREDSSDQDIMVITAATPFYAESGGQVADIGIIEGPRGILTVKDVQKIGDWIIHFGSLNGSLAKGEKVDLKIDSAARMNTAKNHTATHLLHKALRLTLGEHAQQKGSLVEPDRMRFDFSHLSSLSESELNRIEEIVNEAVWDMYEVSTQAASLDEAKGLGAMALFGEKYGEEVRIVQIEDFSLELCGGTHVDNTAQIGLFKILNEGSIGSGLRRIEAVTGQNAIDHYKQAEMQVKNVASTLKTVPADIGTRVDALLKGLKEKEKEIEALKMQFSQLSGGDLIEKAYKINDANILIEIVPQMDANLLRKNAEMLKDKLGTALVLLGTVSDDRVLLVCFASKDLVARGLHAGNIIAAAAKAAGGGGGGRPDMAQAGAKDPEKLADALDRAREMVKKTLL